MIRTPTVCGRPLTITGDDADSAIVALPDDADLVDDVLPVLAELVDDDAVIADIGANVGLYTIALSRLASLGHVYAFEPVPRTVEFLRANVVSNGAENVTVVAEAVGAQAGELEFFDNREFSAGSMVVDHAPGLFRDWLSEVQRQDGTGGARGGFVRVPCTTLDGFAASRGIDRLDVLKIDTEGFDLQVLRGATGTLARLCPAVVVEFASFALTVHAQTLPMDALGELGSRFERLFVVEPGGRLREVSTRDDVLDLLYENATGRPVQDLVGLPAGCRLASRVEGLVGPAGARAPAREPSAEARVAELEQRLAWESAERERLDAELEAMKRTVSWRVTRPLRAVRRRLGAEQD